MNRLRSLSLLLLALPLACSTSRTVPPIDAKAVAERVTRETIERHTRVLASDEFEGRFPGTRGEELAVAYIEREFRRLGLEPAAGDGTYMQWFELQAQRTKGSAVLGSGDSLSPSEAVFAATRVQPRTALQNSELVFAGYGIVAPERDWDDYAGVDVRGKTVLVLRDEPSSTLRGAHSSVHATIERKRAAAYAKGAAAVLLLARGERGFQQWAERFNKELLSLGTEPSPGVIGVLAPSARDRIFAAAKRNADDDSTAAGRRGFRAIPLGVTISIDLQSDWRTIRTRNVIAKLEGSDRSVRDEHVIFSAHWDAFGIGEPVNGDAIYNGAVDDAVGVGQLLATAEALSTTRSPRTILFLVTSAEEHPLLGARHYVAHPVLPLSKALLNINYDIVDTSGATRDVRLFGSGRSTLDEFVEEAAALQGRVVTPDSKEHVPTLIWFQTDHFPFAEAGVPALSVASGADVIGKPADYSDTRAVEYGTKHYHQPSDEVRDDWDWGSIVQDAQLGVLLGLRFAQQGDRVRALPGADVVMGLPAR